MLTTGCVSNSGEIHHARSATAGRSSTRRIPVVTPQPSSWSRMDVGSGLSMPTSVPAVSKTSAPRSGAPAQRLRRDAVGVTRRRSTTAGSDRPRPRLVVRAAIRRQTGSVVLGPCRAASQPSIRTAVERTGSTTLPVTTKSGAPCDLQECDGRGDQRAVTCTGRDGESVERGAQNIPIRHRDVEEVGRFLQKAPDAVRVGCGACDHRDRDRGVRTQPRDDLRRRDERSIDFVYPVCRRGRQRQRRRHAKIGH